MGGLRGLGPELLGEAAGLGRRRCPAELAARWPGTVFHDACGAIMSVAIQTTPKLRMETPKPLLTTNLVPGEGWSEYSVTPDGQRFLVMEPSRQFFTLLQHWLPPSTASR